MESAEQNGVALSLWLPGQNFFPGSDKNYKWGFQTGLRGSAQAPAHTGVGRLGPGHPKPQNWEIRLGLFCLFVLRRKVPSPPDPLPTNWPFQ